MTARTKPTREDCEAIVTCIYEGFTGDGITGKLGITSGVLHARLGTMQITMMEIRHAKRNGKTLGQVIESVDWSFLSRAEKAAEAARERIQKINQLKRDPRIEQLIDDVAYIKDGLTRLLDSYGLLLPQERKVREE